MGNSLISLNKKHKTDKGDKHHTHLGQSYLDIYNWYFEKFRNRKFNFLELGVKEGKSLRLWKEYFPNAQIYGVDFNPDCRKHEEDRIHIFYESQDNINFSVNFDIILDDASHINELTVSSFKKYFHLINPGGLYIIEDLRNSYDNLDKLSWGGSLDKNRKLGVNTKNQRKDMDKFFNNLIDYLDHQVETIRFIHFWSMIVIIGKGDL